MRPLNLIKKAISEGSSFVIATHINPEADAIGSQLAVYRLLQKLNKKAKPILDDEIPSNLKFFPDVVKIHILSGQKFTPEIPRQHLHLKLSLKNLSLLPDPHVEPYFL